MTYTTWTSDGKSVVILEGKIDPRILVDETENGGPSVAGGVEPKGSALPHSTSLENSGAVKQRSPIFRWQS